MDTWKQTVEENNEGKLKVVDTYEGKSEVKTVNQKKYLGEIVSKDLKNEINKV